MGATTPEKPGHYLIESLNGETIIGLHIHVTDRTAVTLTFNSGRWLTLESPGVGNVQMSVIEMGDVDLELPN